MTAYPDRFKQLAFGRLSGAGDRLVMDDIYNGFTSGQRVICTTTTALQAAIAEYEAGTKHCVVIGGNLTSLAISLNSVRDATTMGYIGWFENDLPMIGASATPTVHNIGNYISIAGAYHNIINPRARYAYRSTSQPDFIRFQKGAHHNRITAGSPEGGYLQRCGLGTGGGAITELGSCHDNRGDHLWFDDYRLVSGEAGAYCAWRIEAWTGSLKVTGVVNLGDGTARYTWQQNSYTLANGQTVRVRGFQQDEYNLENVPISSVVINGAASTFVAPITGSPATPGTFGNELQYGLVKPYIDIPALDSIVDFCDFSRFFSGGTAGQEVFQAQDAAPRFPTDNGEESRFKFINNAIYDSNNAELINSKGSLSEVHVVVGFGPRQLVLRQGYGKKVSRCIIPTAALNVNERDHEVYLGVWRSQELRDGGKFDGINDGNSAYTNEMYDCVDVATRKMVFVGDGPLLNIGEQFGYVGAVATAKTDNLPTGCTFEDSVLICTAGTAIDLNGQTIPGVTYDGLHNYNTNGAVSGVTSSNNSTGDPKFKGLFYPTADTPSAILTGGVGSAEQDIYGVDGFNGRGVKKWVAPDPIFSTTFAGTDGIAITDAANFTPDLNETSSQIITATTSLVLDGNGYLRSTANGQSNGINLNSTEQNLTVPFNAFGANNLMEIQCGSNAQRTAGVTYRVSPNQKQVWVIDNALNKTYGPFIHPLLVGNGWQDYRICKYGNLITLFIDEFPVAPIRKTGLTGTYVHWGRGASENNNARWGAVSAETDQISTGAGGGGGTPPATPTTLFDDTYTGAAADVDTYTPDVGVGYSPFKSSVSQKLRRWGDGLVKPNLGATLGAYISHLLDIDPEATVQNNTVFRMEAGQRGNNSGDAWVCGMRVVDTNNYPCVRWRRNGIGLFFVQSGSATQKGSEYSHNYATTDVVEYYINPDNDHHEVYLNGDLVIDYDDSLSPAFPDVGDFFIGTGALVGDGAGSYVDTSHALTRISVTQAVEDIEIPATAAKWIDLPTVDGASTLTAAVIMSADTLANLFSVAHLKIGTPNTVQNVVDGKDSTGATVSTTASAADVAAGTLTTLSITGLDDLTVSGKPPAIIQVDSTATVTDDPDDILMTAPVSEIYYLPTDMEDTTTPLPGEFIRFKVADIALLDQNGWVLTNWPEINNGAVVEYPAFDDSGTYSNYVDPVTGIKSFDSQGNPATLTGANAWFYGEEDWEEGADGLTESITSPYTAVISALEFANNTGSKTPASTEILVSIYNFGDTTSLHGIGNVSAVPYTVASDNSVTLEHIIAGLHEVQITDTAGNLLWADKILFA